MISIHALREEGDLVLCGGKEGFRIFLSTPSARRATCKTALPQHHLPISIHALREEGDGMPQGVEPSKQISIHPLREEGDCFR